MANINFFFTVECPHCGKLFEVSHLALEVLFNTTDLGICKHCGLMVTAHLTSRAVDATPTSAADSESNNGVRH